MPGVQGSGIHPFAFQLRVEMWGREEAQQRLTDEATLSKAVFGSTNAPPPPKAASEPTLCFETADS